jgi:hypothetical protein
VKLVNVAGATGAGAVADRLAGYTPPTLRQLVQSCVLVWGGPWRVDHCEVRASGGVAVRVMRRGSVEMEHVGLGGLGPDADVAAMGVSLQEAGACSLERCLIEHTDGAPGTAGLCAQDRSRASARGCVLRDHVHGAAVGGAAALTLVRCLFERTQASAVMFSDSLDAAAAALHVRRCIVRGAALLSGGPGARQNRPAKLELSDNIVQPPRDDGSEDAP